MNSLRGRFLISHLLPILLVVPLVGAALIATLETQVLLNDLAAGMNERAQLLAEVANQYPEVWQDAQAADQLLQRVGLMVEGEVFLLTPDGIVIARSERSTTVLRLSRSELQVLRSGQTSTRMSYGLLDQEAVVVVPVSNLQEEVVGLVGVSQNVQSAASVFGELRRFVVVLIGVELLLGIVLAIYLARRLERPIGRAITSVGDIARGKYDVSLELSGPRELRDLTSSVNMLAQRLASLEGARRRSLANIVHEIGRPLGGIRSAIHVLRGPTGGDTAVREELLAGMEEQIEQVSPLLDDLARLHGQVSGEVALERREVDFGEWLMSALLPGRAAALEKGLDWEVTLPENLPKVLLDPERMNQVVGNLLSNAVKYTPAGGRVALQAGATNEEVWFTVADTGPGIHPAEQEQIFEPFYRSVSERRFPQGLGLGLTIARSLVEAHGGRLGVESAPGEGSRFGVVLPRRALATTDQESEAIT